MSHRFQIVLPDAAAEQLHELAAVAEEPPSTAAARIIRDRLAEAAQSGLVRRARRPSPPAALERPPWFEPYGGDRSWKRRMWGDIVALCSRYPEPLQSLKDGWWSDAVDTEILCALAVWRGEIDAAAQNPREELVFHRELDEFARALRSRSTGVAGAWEPGAPPEEWLSG